MRISIIISLLMAMTLSGGDSALGFDLPEKIMQEFEYLDLGPRIEIDGQGNLHVLYRAMHSKPDKFMQFEELRYYKYRLPDCEMLFSYIDDERPSIGSFYDYVY